MDETSYTTDAAQLLTAHLRQVHQLGFAHSAADLAEQPHRYETRNLWTAVRCDIRGHARRADFAQQLGQVLFELSSCTGVDTRQR